MSISCADLQEETKKVYERNGWETDSTLLIVAMGEELGELCARWLAEHPDYEKNLEDTDDLIDNIGDLGQLVLAFCNNEGIDFAEAVRSSLEKRKKG